MLRRFILGAICALDGRIYYCPFCSYTAEYEAAMGAHILSAHPKGR